MYKIYINDTPLILMQQADSSIPEAGDTRLVARYPGKSKFLLHYINMLENTRRWEAIWLFSPDPEGMWTDFLQLFELREVAGCVIRDDRDRIFFLQEGGQWHLPTDPVVPGSDPAATAVALVGKMTGREVLPVLSPCSTTYHARREDGQRVLYKTSWFGGSVVSADVAPATISGQWMGEQDLGQKNTVIPARMLSIFRK